MTAVAQHGMGFAAAGLPVCETRNPSSVESTVDKGSDGCEIDLGLESGYLLVGCMLIVSSVEVELILVDVRGQIYL